MLPLYLALVRLQEDNRIRSLSVGKHLAYNVGPPSYV